MHVRVSAIGAMVLLVFFTCRLTAQETQEENRSTAGAAVQGEGSSAMSESEAVALVQKNYREILHREADPEGLATHVEALLENGRDETWLKQSLMSSQEWAELQRERQNVWAFFFITGGVVVGFIGTALLLRSRNA